MVKIYQRGNKKQYVKEGHSIQWSKDIKRGNTKQYIKEGHSIQLSKDIKRGNTKQYIKEGHSIQWSKDTKEVIRNSTSKKDIQYNGQKMQKM